MGWTQPVCEVCWTQMNPDRPAHRMVDADTEICCFCGRGTQSGIYTRVDPKTVPFPAKDDD